MGLNTLQIGHVAPDFSLPGIDGRVYSLGSFAEASILVIIFSCNHCPYVQAYEDRLVSVQHDYGTEGVQLLAINSNDEVNYPEDNLHNMVARAAAKEYNFPYLRDVSQQVARSYGATHTPHLFVFGMDRRLRYTGRIDDNWERPSAVTRRYLREALDQLLKGTELIEATTHAIGCTIKWRTSADRG